MRKECGTSFIPSSFFFLMCFNKLTFASLFLFVCLFDYNPLSPNGVMSLGRFLLSLLLGDIHRNLFMGPSNRATGRPWWNVLGGSKSLSKFILGDYKKFRTQSSFWFKGSWSSLCKQGFAFTLHVHIQKKHAADSKYLVEIRLCLFKLEESVLEQKNMILLKTQGEFISSPLST